MSNADATSAPGPLPSDPRPGPTTSEFWTSLLTTVVSLSIAIADLFRTDFDPSGLQSLIPAVAVIAAAITSAVYAHSRTSAKNAALQAAASAVASQLTPMPSDLATRNGQAGVLKPYPFTPPIGVSR